MGKIGAKIPTKHRRDSAKSRELGHDVHSSPLKVASSNVYEELSFNLHPLNSKTHRKAIIHCHHSAHSKSHRFSYSNLQNQILIQTLVVFIRQI